MFKFYSPQRISRCYQFRCIIMCGDLLRDVQCFESAIHTVPFVFNCHMSFALREKSEQGNLLLPIALLCLCPRPEACIAKWRAPSSLVFFAPITLQSNRSARLRIVAWRPPSLQFRDLEMESFHIHFFDNDSLAFAIFMLDSSAAVQDLHTLYRIMQFANLPDASWCYT